MSEAKTPADIQTDLATASPRKQALYGHIRQQDYICNVGRDMARRDILSVVELQHDQTAEQRYDATAQATNDFLLKKQRGLVIIFPEEPATHDALKSAVTEHYADFLTAVVMESIRSDREALEPLLRELRIFKRSMPVPMTEVSEPANTVDANLVSISPAHFVSIAEGKTQTEDYPTDQSVQSIRVAVKKVLATHPNIVPNYRGDGMFTFALSSVYTDDKEEERAAARTKYDVENLPHQRFSPVTCLVINWHSEIVRVMHTTMNDEIQLKKVRAPYMLDPNRTVAEPYTRFDRVLDAYIMLGSAHMKLLEKMVPPEVHRTLESIQKTKFQALYMAEDRLLRDRLAHINGEIADEDFFGRCEDWDRQLQEEMRKDMEMIMRILNAPMPSMDELPSLDDMPMLMPTSPAPSSRKERILDEIASAFEEKDPRPFPKMPLPEPSKKEERQKRNDPCSCGSGKKFKHCHGR